MLARCNVWVVREQPQQKAWKATAHLNQLSGRVVSMEVAVLFADPLQGDSSVDILRRWGDNLRTTMLSVA